MPWGWSHQDTSDVALEPCFQDSHQQDETHLSMSDESKSAHKQNAESSDVAPYCARTCLGKTERAREGRNIWTSHLEGREG